MDPISVPEFDIATFQPVTRMCEVAPYLYPGGALNCENCGFIFICRSADGQTFAFPIATVPAFVDAVAERFCDALPWL